MNEQSRSRRALHREFRWLLAQGCYQRAAELADRFSLLTTDGDANHD